MKAPPFYLLYVTAESPDGPVNIVAWVHPFPDGSSARSAETRAHGLFGACRMYGEWFDVNPYIAAEVIQRELKLGPALDVDMTP